MDNRRVGWMGTIWLIALCAGASLAGCNDGHATAPGGLPTVQVPIGRRTFTLEVAADEKTRARGLMYRDTMPADHGMLFVFPRASEQYFWMKNTRIALDILFLDAELRVVSIGHMKPYDLNTTASYSPAQYAIELNAGAAKEAGVSVGDVVPIPPAARRSSDR